MKQIIFWDAKKVPLRDKSGNEIPGEFTGVFSNKGCPPNTPGAYRYAGQMPAPSTVKWDYWAFEATVIRGHLRWIDKIMPTFSGAQAQLVLFVESEKYLNRIQIRYDVNNLHDIMNGLCGLGKALPETFLNVNYGVWKSKDKNGQFKLTDKNEIRWTQKLQFADVDPEFDFEGWRDKAQRDGLEWEKITVNGKQIWTYDAELKYWDGRLVAMQRFLLDTPGVLPFTYGSMTACEGLNPSGGGNLTTAEIAQCARIYERVKAEYKMPFGRVDVDADSYDPSAVAQPAHVSQSVVKSEAEYTERYAETEFTPDPVAPPKNSQMIEGFDDDSLPF